MPLYRPVYQEEFTQGKIPLGCFKLVMHSLYPPFSSRCWVSVASYSDRVLYPVRIPQFEKLQKGERLEQY